MHITGRTQIVGVIGDPIGHTLSPAMHNAAFAALGLDWVYVPCHVLPKDMGGAVAAVRALSWRGLNITVPHKQAVIPFLDELLPAAEAVGAVNTIINSDGRLLGDNTDVFGILSAIRIGAGVALFPPVVAVLGAGGAARGVVYALSTVAEVEEIRVLNRTPERADALANEFGRLKPITAFPLARESARDALQACGLLINVTSMGRGALAHETPLPPEWDCIPADTVLVDSNYSPPETPLMRQVRTAGGRAYNGLDMLVYQGARSFRHWTGVEPPIEIMRNAAVEQMGM
jgi:shikimate dehydrogenase